MAKTKSSNPGLLFLFAIPIAAVGLGMGIWLFYTLGMRWSARDWVEIPATILEVELHKSRGSGKQKRTTYRCDARYTYEYKGQSHESTRVSFYGASDNFGSFHRDKYTELRAHQSTIRPSSGTAAASNPRGPQGKKFRCYVNPANPSEAVLYPELRLPIIAFQSVFALVFGGVGIALIAAGIADRKKPRTRKKLGQPSPGEP